MRGFKWWQYHWTLDDDNWILYVRYLHYQVLICGHIDIVFHSFSTCLSTPGLFAFSVFYSQLLRTYLYISLSLPAFNFSWSKSFIPSLKRSLIFNGFFFSQICDSLTFPKYCWKQFLNIIKVDRFFIIKGRVKHAIEIGGYDQISMLYYMAK